MRFKKFTIRKAKIKDIPKLIDVEKQCWLDTYPDEKYKIFSRDINERFENINFYKDRKSELSEDIRNLNNKLLMVVSFEKTIIGYIRGWKEKTFNDLVEIYILKKYRSSGIGRYLLNMLFNWFDKEKPIILEVAVYNKKAIEFYKKNKFKEDKFFKQPSSETWNVLPSGKRLPVILMRRNS